MKYKVGDKVKIRKDLDASKMYGAWDCSLSMKSYSGMIATIVNCYHDSYHIDIDNECYDWTDEMFEDIEPNIVTLNTVYRTVDVGFHLDYCGHRVLKDVWQGGIANHGHVFFNTKDNNNQYVLPTDAIDFIIPHED